MWFLPLKQFPEELRADGNVDIFKFKNSFAWLLITIFHVRYLFHLIIYFIIFMFSNLVFPLIYSVCHCLLSLLSSFSFLLKQCY